MSGPPATIISPSPQNIRLHLLYLIVLNLLRIYTRRHHIYCPGISAANRPHNLVISPAITHILFHRYWTLSHAIVCLLKLPYMMSRISDVPHICYFHPCLPTSPPPPFLSSYLPVSLSLSSLLYYICEGTCVRRHLWCFASMLSWLSRVSTTTIVILMSI